MLRVKAEKAMDKHWAFLSRAHVPRSHRWLSVLLRRPSLARVKTTRCEGRLEAQGRGPPAAAGFHFTGSYNFSLICYKVSLRGDCAIKRPQLVDIILKSLICVVELTSTTLSVGSFAKQRPSESHRDKPAACSLVHCEDKIVSHSEISGFKIIMRS